MAEEKRFHKRFTISQFISISFESEEFIKVTGEDISLGGVRCRSAEKVYPLTRAYLMISLPLDDGEYIIKTEAVVIHSQEEEKDYILGLRFVDLFESDRRALEKYLSEIEV